MRQKGTIFQVFLFSIYEVNIKYCYRDFQKKKNLNKLGQIDFLDKLGLFTAGKPIFKKFLSSVVYKKYCKRYSFLS
jgi:hypothetical protein